MVDGGDRGEGACPMRNHAGLRRDRLERGKEVSRDAEDELGVTEVEGRKRVVHPFFIFSFFEFVAFMAFSARGETGSGDRRVRGETGGERRDGISFDARLLHRLLFTLPLVLLVRG